eukprot:jgi/Bigna1/134859/aug1.27_g9567
MDHEVFKVMGKPFGCRIFRNSHARLHRKLSQSSILSWNPNLGNISRGFLVGKSVLVRAVRCGTQQKLELQDVVYFMDKMPCICHQNKDMIGIPGKEHWLGPKLEGTRSSPQPYLKPTPRQAVRAR